MMTMDGDGERLDKATALSLAGRICARATQQAVASCELLELIGEFDAGGGLGYLSGVKSVAHWVGYACAMSPGVAREHVRVARAMRRMPTITAAFRAGELSYSKVREVTRVVGLVDEARLCELARAASASQLARTIAGYRAAAGTRIGQQERRRFRLIVRPGAQSMVGISGQVPADEAAVVAAAVQRARELNGTPPPLPDAGTDDPTPGYGEADALRDICQHYLNTAATADESGEDRSLVVIQIAAEQLLGPDHDPTGRSPVEQKSTENVPAGTSADDVAAAGTIPSGTPSTEPDEPVPDRTRTSPIDPTGPPRAETADVGNVPAGTSSGAGVCTIRGLGGIEPATARRAVCTGTLLGAIIDAQGDVLALGRTRRLVSKTQRRALLIRDRTCQFPGCTSSRHLQAHHVISWADGGPTDQANLILLCRFHHTCVHEGGITITRDRAAPFRAADLPGEPPWTFRMPDGQPVDRPGWLIPPADTLIRRLVRPDPVDHIDRLNHPDAVTIQPKQYGERFDLHAAVRVLFDLETAVSEAA